MLLVDFSNLSFSSALAYTNMTGETLDMPLLRHILLKRLLSTVRSKRKSNERVVCCIDSKDHWRKDIFPNYKHGRKKSRDDSKMDWNYFFEQYSLLKYEFRKNIPYHFIEVDRVEADDIIYALALKYHPHERILIISSDRDFLQLQQTVSSKIQQYSIAVNRLITPEDSDYDLFTHVLRGDPGDGIPNFYAPDDHFVSEERQRQKPLSMKNLKEWSRYGLSKPEVFCKSAEHYDGFMRNLKLIDMRQIPEEILESIYEEFEDTKVVNNLMNYLMENGCFNIIKEITK